MFNDTIFGPESTSGTQQHSWWLNDGQAAAVVPVISYWLMCGLFEAIEYFGLFKQYKIYPTEEEQKRNIAPKSQVIRYVFIQQSIQTIFALVMASWEHPAPIANDAFGQTLYFRNLLKDAPALQPWEEIFLAWCLRLTYLAVRQLAAFIVYDAWSYFIHYVEHNNAYLYKNIHSVHHKLYNPYSWGTLYNHPLEGFYLDTLGAYIGKAAIGLSHREATFFFTLATVKATNDHCGYNLPWDPIRLFGYLTGNGLYFHNVHHQSWGLKTNFALYFTFWDRLFSTMYRGSRPLVAKKAAEKEMRDGIAVDYNNSPVRSETPSEMPRQRRV